MYQLTAEERRIAEESSQRYSFSFAAVEAALVALIASGGRMAQFSHPELGGMGQWSQGGMIMIGDMFNSSLKERVDALCNDLSKQLTHSSEKQLAAPETKVTDSGNSFASFNQTTAHRWWPGELGAPSSVGMQNDCGYACFPSMRRLAILSDGHVTVYDTGSHQITGFSQKQSTSRSLTFISNTGLVSIDELTAVV